MILNEANVSYIYFIDPIENNCTIGANPNQRKSSHNGVQFFEWNQLKTVRFVDICERQLSQADEFAILDRKPVSSMQHDHKYHWPKELAYSSSNETSNNQTSTSNSILEWLEMQTTITLKVTEIKTYTLQVGWLNEEWKKPLLALFLNT